jgi:hypothetical protein
MSDTETETGEIETTGICLYPGCEEPVVPQHKHGGPPPRYCANDDHNAGSTFQALKAKGEAPDVTGPAAAGE